MCLDWVNAGLGQQIGRHLCMSDLIDCDLNVCSARLDLNVFGERVWPECLFVCGEPCSDEAMLLTCPRLCKHVEMLRKEFFSVLRYTA